MAKKIKAQPKPNLEFLRLLEEEGLIEKTDDGYKLTEAGLPYIPFSQQLTLIPQWVIYPGILLEEIVNVGLSG